MKKTLRPWIFVGLAIAMLIVATWIARAVINERASARLEQTIAELQAAGEPVRLADLAHPTIAPDSNAATYLRRARRDIESIDEEIFAINDVDMDEFYRGHLTPPVEKIVRSAFEAYPKAIPLVEQAGACSDYDPQLDVTVEAREFMTALVAQVDYWRKVIRVLYSRTLLQLADGQREEALQTCRSMFRLTQYFDHDPTVIGFLVSLACRGYVASATDCVLRAGPISNTSRDELEAELARHNLVDSYRQALKTDRAYGLEYFRQLPADAPPRKGYPWWATNLKSDQNNYLALIDEERAIASLPYAEAMQSPAIRRVLHGPLAKLIAPEIQAMLGAIHRSEAQMRCLRVLNAVQRHETDANAAEPKLSELGLPAEAITDPFNGQPLHLKKLPEGWLIYSVGTNLKDDGGKLAELDDVGLGPRLTKAAETGHVDSKPAGKAQ